MAQVVAKKKKVELDVEDREEDPDDDSTPLILVVDDSESTRKLASRLFREALAQHGVRSTVHHAESGEEALEKCQALSARGSSYALISMDICLGSEVLDGACVRLGDRNAPMPRYAAHSLARSLARANRFACLCLCLTVTCLCTSSLVLSLCSLLAAAS